MKAVLLLLLPLIFASCGTPKARKCHFIPFPSREPAPSLIAQARSAHRDLERKFSPAALQNYNSATAKLVDQLVCGPGTFDQKAQQMGTVIDRKKTLGTGLNLEDLDSLIPASKVAVSRIGLRHRESGIGIPLVGWKNAGTIEERRFQFAPPTGLPLNLTAYLDFDQKIPTWRFLYGGRIQTVLIGARAEKLAVDWSAPSAFYWRMSDLDDFDIAKVIVPTRFAHHAGLYFATPYDPGKIPVVFVHGLASSPGTFARMHNDLMGKPWFRENYQALFFSYPTGVAWPYNAAKFRRQLREARQLAASKGPLKNWNRMVLVGHSMGGVISRASLVDPGDRFYEASYRRPVEELNVSPTTLAAIKQVRLYRPLPSPSRAIFLAAPHQGSPLADRFFSRWIRSAIQLPKTLTIDLATTTLAEITKAITEGGNPRPPLTSIGTLTPRYKAYQAIHRSPFKPGLKYHSVIGNRGHLGPVKDSSDGVVPYWSAHLPGARSEKIVPAYHSLCANPETIAEVSRILELHLMN